MSIPVAACRAGPLFRRAVEEQHERLSRFELSVRDHVRAGRIQHGKSAIAWRSGIEDRDRSLIPEWCRAID